jgi:phenylpropionate dioxygenase-like ring-hydroxylating dioxygenase large terminal subunit
MAIAESPLLTGPAPRLDSIDVVPPPDDSFMDPRSYFSPAFYDLEMRTIFPRSWVFVADVEDLPQPGDYVTETIGYEPIVVVRDAGGAIRAFSNVCTHRASLLVEGSGNAGRNFTCPYHGWTFQLDGSLTGISYRREFACPVDPAKLALRPLRAEVWERWVFVNVSGGAPPLLDWLENVPSLVRDHQLVGTLRGHRLDDLVEANWKVVIDNAYCDYHLPFVHAKSLGQFVDPHRLEETVGRYTGMLFSPSALYSPYQRRPGIAGKAAEGSLGFSVFPNWFLVAFPNGGATVMWWTPVSIDRTRARVINYTRDPEEDPRASLDLLVQIQREDYAICEKVQKGLRSAMYRVGPRHGLELRIRAYQQLLMTMLARELDRQAPGHAS